MLMTSPGSSLTFILESRLLLLTPEVITLVITPEVGLLHSKTIFSILRSTGKVDFKCSDFCCEPFCQA